MAVMFGQLISLVTAYPVNGTVIALFKAKGRPVEVTLPSRAFVHTGQTTFVFNRPISQAQDQCLFIQVIQTCQDGFQHLLGYACMDMAAKHAGRSVQIPVWLSEDPSSAQFGTLVFHIQSLPGYT